ncbi:MAG: LapA family protein [Sulfuritalea sp.]|nr:LapA family protein [Sulfuritalea sp.]
MNFIIWLLRVALFVVLLGFAVKNSGAVTLRFFFDSAWSLPLVVVMLIFFAAGAFVGLSAALGVFLRQRRETARLRKALDSGAHPSR